MEWLVVKSLRQSRVMQRVDVSLVLGKEVDEVVSHFRVTSSIAESGSVRNEVFVVDRE